MSVEKGSTGDDVLTSDEDTTKILGGQGNDVIIYDENLVYDEDGILYSDTKINGQQDYDILKIEGSVDYAIDLRGNTIKGLEAVVVDDAVDGLIQDVKLDLNEILREGDDAADATNKQYDAFSVITGNDFQDRLDLQSLNSDQSSTWHYAGLYEDVGGTALGVEEQSLIEAEHGKSLDGLLFGYTFENDKGDQVTIWTDLGDYKVSINGVAIGVNDSPVLMDDTFQTLEDTALEITTADLLANDADPENDDLVVTDVKNAINGTVTLNGDDVIFTPDVDLNDGNTQDFGFTYTVFDGDNYVDAFVNVDVLSVNDAPIGADNSITIDEDTTRTLTATDFGFSDPNDDPANTFKQVVINSLQGASGSLKLNGQPVSTGTAVLVSNLANLVFEPEANANGDNFLTLGFFVVDDGGTANGGQDTSLTENFITFNVTAVNDPPQAVDDNFEVDETLPGAAATAVGNVITNPDGLDSDIDNLLSELSVTPISQLVTSAKGNAMQIDLLADGTLTVDQLGNFEALGFGETDTVTFDYTLSDGELTDTATVTITVNGFAPPLFTELADGTELAPIDLNLLAASEFFPGTQYDALGGDDIVQLADSGVDTAVFDFSQTFFAGDGNDIIRLGDTSSGGETSRVNLGTGDDQVSMAPGTSILEGGDGFDTLNFDTLVGNTDTIVFNIDTGVGSVGSTSFTATGFEWIYAGPGTLELTGSTFDGGYGNLVDSAGASTFTANFTAGNDTVILRDAVATVDSGDGDDLFLLLDSGGTGSINGGINTEATYRNHILVEREVAPVTLAAFSAMAATASAVAFDPADYDLVLTLDIPNTAEVSTSANTISGRHNYDVANIDDFEFTGDFNDLVYVSPQANTDSDIAILITDQGDQIIVGYSTFTELRVDLGDGDSDTVSFKGFTPTAVALELSFLSTSPISLAEERIFFDVKAQVTGVGYNMNDDLSASTNNTTLNAGSQTIINEENFEGVTNGADFVFASITADESNVYIGGDGGGDTLSYILANGGVNVNLTPSDAPAAVDTGSAGMDTIVGFENLVGSAFDDTLSTSLQESVLFGFSGDDVLEISAADASVTADRIMTLNGGDGNDTLRLTSDIFSNVAVTATLFGGAGADIFELAGRAFANLDITIDGSQDAVSRDVVHFTTGTLQSGFRFNTDQFLSGYGNISTRNIEGVIGVTSSSAQNNDKFFAATTISHAIDGGLGNDLGNDTLDYSDYNIGSGDAFAFVDVNDLGISIDMNNLSRQSVAFNDVLADFLVNNNGFSAEVAALVSVIDQEVKNIERVVGTQGNDKIVASAEEGANARANTYNAGDGTRDIISYEGATEGSQFTGVLIDLVSELSYDTYAGGMDRLIGFENAVGSDGNDTIFNYGNTDSNISIHTPGAGDDYIVGRGAAAVDIVRLESDMLFYDVGINAGSQEQGFTFKHLVTDETDAAVFIRGLETPQEIFTANTSTGVARFSLRSNVTFDEPTTTPTAASLNQTTALLEPIFNWAVGGNTQLSTRTINPLTGVSAEKEGNIVVAGIDGGGGGPLATIFGTLYAGIENAPGLSFNAGTNEFRFLDTVNTIGFGPDVGTNDIYLGSSSLNDIVDYSGQAITFTISDGESVTRTPSSKSSTDLDSVYQIKLDGTTEQVTVLVFDRGNGNFEYDYLRGIEFVQFNDSPASGTKITDLINGNAFIQLPFDNEDNTRNLNAAPEIEVSDYNSLGGNDSVTLSGVTTNGWDANRVFYASGGNDDITGLGLNDKIDGGEGDDTLTAGGGDFNILHGGAEGNDRAILSTATALDVADLQLSYQNVNFGELTGGGAIKLTSVLNGQQNFLLDIEQLQIGTQVYQLATLANTKLQTLSAPLDTGTGSQAYAFALPSSTNNTLNGTASNDIMLAIGSGVTYQGLAGNDVFYSDGTGGNVFVGGEGTIPNMMTDTGTDTLVVSAKALDENGDLAPSQIGITGLNLVDRLQVEGNTLVGVEKLGVNGTVYDLTFKTDVSLIGTAFTTDPDEVILNEALGSLNPDIVYLGDIRGIAGNDGNVLPLDNPVPDTLHAKDYTYKLTTGDSKDIVYAGDAFAGNGGLVGDVNLNQNVDNEITTSVSDSNNDDGYNIRFRTDTEETYYVSKPVQGTDGGDGSDVKYDISLGAGDDILYTGTLQAGKDGEGDLILRGPGAVVQTSNEDDIIGQGGDAGDAIYQIDLGAGNDVVYINRILETDAGNGLSQVELYDLGVIGLAQYQVMNNQDSASDTFIIDGGYTNLLIDGWDSDPNGAQDVLDLSSFEDQVVIIEQQQGTGIVTITQGNTGDTTESSVFNPATITIQNYFGTLVEGEDFFF